MVSMVADLALQFQLSHLKIEKKLRFEAAVRTSPQMFLDCKLSPNLTANDPKPQVNHIVGHKWSQPKNQEWYGRWNVVDRELVWIGTVFVLKPSN